MPEASLRDHDDRRVMGSEVVYEIARSVPRKPRGRHVLPARGLERSAPWAQRADPYRPQWLRAVDRRCRILAGIDEDTKRDDSRCARVGGDQAVPPAAPIAAF